ncbi:MAG: Type 1 glutamine amidotransferase-like domain-containing protein [Pseudomonadales bacterium]|nr:Type 1 glutamine amidotransferase-like domain-containing protein [Pseudomonadales bacterium]
MKYYLSSYKLGNIPGKFASLFTQGKSIAYIPNATDFTEADPASVRPHIEADVKSLEKLGLDVKILDLKKYFQTAPEKLESIVNSLSGLWVSGGNVFVLRQAMMLSGIDRIIIEKSKEADFIYPGYSAGCCVLSHSLRSYQFASDANDVPYSSVNSTLGRFGVNRFCVYASFPVRSL